MRFPKFLCISCLLALLIVSNTFFSRVYLYAQASDSNEGISEAEKETVQKARNPEEKLKAYLEIANERMKVIDSATHKEKGDELALAVNGFRSALNSAEELVAGVQASKGTGKRMTETLLKAARKYNASLLEILRKASEDLRKYIQSAYEVSERVADGLVLQLEKNSR
jgi:hypothetical protein